MSVISLSVPHAWRASARRGWRFARYAAERFQSYQCFQTAAALTYTTLLSAVPLMTIGFALFAAFPAFRRIEAHLQNLIFEYLVPQAGDVLRQYLERFTHNAGQLTALGLVGLAVSAFLVLATIEQSFNAIWHASVRRPLVVRLLAFWAILTLTPLLLGASLAVSDVAVAFLGHAGVPARSSVGRIIGYGLPPLAALGGLTLLYVVIPGSDVRWRDALAGAAVGTVLLELARAGYAVYLAHFPAYETIYGALSVLPTFLVWLYLVWLAMLMGAVVTAALPDWRAGAGHGEAVAAPGRRLRAALSLLGILAAAARDGRVVQARTLIRRLPESASVTLALLQDLKAAGWVVRAEQGGWAICRDLSAATLYDLLAGLGIPAAAADPGHKGWEHEVCRLVTEADRASRAVLAVPVRTVLPPD